MLPIFPFKSVYSSENKAPEQHGKGTVLESIVFRTGNPLTNMKNLSLGTILKPDVLFFFFLCANAKSGTMLLT